MVPWLQKSLKNLSTMRLGSYKEMTTNLRLSDSWVRAHDLSNQWFFDYRSLWKNLSTMRHGSYKEMTTNLRLSDSFARAHDLSNQWYFDYRSLWKNLSTMRHGFYKEMTTILRLSDSRARAMAVWFISKECVYPSHSSVFCTNNMIRSIGQPFTLQLLPYNMMLFAW